MIVLGISGYARSGKDTYVSIAREILERNGYPAFRVAFATKLKAEIEAMLEANNFKTSIYTDDTAAKTLMRPLPVWWGCQRRRESEGGAYWIDEASIEVDEIGRRALDEGTYLRTVILVSDVRFPNEAKWIKEDLGGEVIHLKRYSVVTERLVLGGEWELFKRLDPAPNEEEEKQDPLVLEMSDQDIEWENKGNLPPEEAVKESYLREVVLTSLRKSKFFSERVLK